MKRISFLLISLVFLSSCDDSEDVFSKINIDPVISFNSNRVPDSEAFEDSVKVRDKVYTFNYTVVDDQINTPELNFKESSNVNDVVLLSENQISLKFSAEGRRVLSFYVKDAFGQTTVKEAIITAYNNLLPVAVFKLIDTKSPISSLERKLDLSESFDKDQNFGGKIISYSFQIDNQKEVTTDKSFIYHIFQMQGTYIIKLKTQDDDLVWSETLVKTVKI